MNKTKLSARAIEEIKANSGRGGKTYKELAIKYGVHVMTINSWANDSLRERSRLAKNKWQSAHKDKIRVKARERNQRMKRHVLSQYSPDLKCACCGEYAIEFLSIDHIGGGGAKHRKAIGNGKIYSWLMKNNYPKGFRVLCMNCNHAYGHYETCPHALMARKSKSGT